MNLEKTDTIAAIATAHGVGSIAIVRLSGPEALAIAQKITKKALKPRFAHLRTLYNYQDEIIDQAIVIYFKAPHSFTGEDIVEFQCHGGIIVADMVLRTLLHHGARLAEPGEFSKRAFLNGKIDLSEAEAIAKIIEAKSEDAAKILARQLKGELASFVEEVREQLIRILAYVEVNIDYAEEDLPVDLQEQMQNQLETISKNLAKILESSKRREGLIEGFKVAIIGKPNTGKSSLLNALLNYERAIVSDIAGTTRDTIEESVRIGSHLVRFVDTAGIREAQDTIERIGVERSIKAIEESDIVIAMFDASKPLESEDQKIIDLIQRYKNEKDIIVILNKIDLGKEITIEDIEPIELSVKQDISPLIKKLQTILDSYANTEEILLVSRRQIDTVTKALEAINAAKIPLEMGELEIFAFHINEAITAIGSITRPMESSELLDKMFGEFCLGK
ncbi:tRNA modification GTPase [Nitratiruptor sp. YY08-26]|uniref:tRNA uridine-5-carboxymethylaminomethyl(34) synthesis GTPase MnmE n=1 Tax=unclassified Nitratiruptor TaxID=2624044 RepID=UPI001915F066|nr:MULTISPECIES: tRNA uridine-5-carboxymethylaminomethyl(34) synthesis GTPase MnmE [unclassified Nitratiruptor]BCD62321.1 tRNA modification GTPase [Nitratiruptor sp. YY08-13]BCD66257.1 tRNA modification GTPase [Nitratiruptor sp. YY08-26]